MTGCKSGEGRCTLPVGTWRIRSFPRRGPRRPSAVLLEARTQPIYTPTTFIHPNTPPLEETRIPSVGSPSLRATMNQGIVGHLLFRNVFSFAKPSCMCVYFRSSFFRVFRPSSSLLCLRILGVVPLLLLLTTRADFVSRFPARAGRNLLRHDYRSSMQWKQSSGAIEYFKGLKKKVEISRDVVSCLAVAFEKVDGWNDQWCTCECMVNERSLRAHMVLMIFFFFGRVLGVGVILCSFEGCFFA